MNKELIFRLSKKYSSFYLYDETRILQNIATLRHAFPNVNILYSMKSNPNQKLLRIIFNTQVGADAASINEVNQAAQIGLPKEKIFYSAPGKSVIDITEGIKKATLIADSISEIKKINSIGKKENKVINIGVRINPNFSFDSQLGTPSKFGIDEDQLFHFLKQHIANNIKIVGIHIHLRSQVLNTQNLISYYHNIFSLSDKIQKKLRHQLSFINMGSGIGVPYSITDKSVDLNTIGNYLNRFEQTATKLIIESGRYITSNAGIYVTKILDRKISHGKIYLILSNTLNGFLRPSIAMLIKKYNHNPHLKTSEPLFTETEAFQFIPIAHQTSDKVEKVTLVGNLCTTTDIIAEDIMMPYLKEGDLIAIPNAGAYGASLSPAQFSSLNSPKEFIIHSS